MGMNTGKLFESWGAVTNCYYPSICVAELQSRSRGGNGFCAATVLVSWGRPGIIGHMFQAWLRREWFFSQVSAKCGAESV